MSNKRRYTLFLILVIALVGLFNVGITQAQTADLLITGAIDGPLLGGTPKAVEFYVLNDIPDLSIYGFGSANNGGGTDGEEFTFPADSATAGDFIYVATEEPQFIAWFGFAPNYTNGAAPSINGDDAIELFQNGVVIDVFGDINLDGTSQPWEHLDGWTYRVDATGPDGSTFILANWTFSGPNALDGELTNATAATPFPTSSYVPGSVEPSDPELLLTEIVVTPTDGEFIEIHNPTGSAIDLSDFYITDATYSGGGTYYYNIVTGTNAGGGGFSDFHARFPDGASIAAGEYQAIALAGSDGYFATYGINPAYELFEDGLSADGIPDMREALPGSIADQGGLSNSGEVVILYYWDGASDLALDMDYAIWGDTAEAVDKTGVTIDGPDADADASAYLNDTPIASQDLIAGAAHISGNSWQRDSLTEGAEISAGGNGVNSEDETSEDLSNTWCEGLPTPGAATFCPPPPPPSDLVINEFLADPAGDLTGDANGDGTRDSSQDEFIEIVNSGTDDLDISGWEISDGYSVRHIFPANTVVTASCSVVVFGGGTPTGAFGGSVVQTASTESLGLNNSGDSITLTDSVSTAASYSYGSEGGDNQSLTRDPDITGLDFVKHSTATNSAGALFSPGTMIDGSKFSNICGGPTAYKIHEIQGSGLASPLVGDIVTIEGVVVGDFQEVGEFGGFHVQEEDSDVDSDPATSEGVFVYHYSAAVTLGDVVQVTGTVAEYYGLTQLTSISDVTVVSSGASVTAATVSLPVTSADDFEAFEGMSVVFPQALTISEYFNYDRYGEIVLSTDRQFQPTAVYEPGSLEAEALATANALARIILDDGRSGQNPDPARHPNGADFDLTNLFRGGDQVQNLIGVVDFAFGNYKIQPTGGADYIPQNPRTTLDEVSGSLKVASFNVLNYFTTLGSRGADDLEEFERQRAKIIAAIADIDADVVGLIEIENNTDAIVDLVTGLNDLMGAGTYAYVDTGVIGTDEIKVAFIYKPAAVTAVGNYAILDSGVDPLFNDDKNRPVLAQTFEDNNGGAVTVAVNHLKSKGSSCEDIGDPDTGDGSGNCNLTRTAAAQALVNWLASDPTGSGDADFLIIGDLNSYDKEDPIDALLAGGYTDLAHQLLGEYAYSYVFSGQFGYLDYALANQDLLSQVTGVTIWNINADEPDILDYDTTYKEDAQDALYEPNAYRSSDHDPVIVGLDLNAPPVCSEAYASVETLWPPNHEMAAIEVLGVTDPDGDAVTITIDAIFQDEPVNGLGAGDTAPDGDGVGTATALVRAERDGAGNGRYYHIYFTATDSSGNSCSGEALVSVPKNQGRKGAAVDDGPLFDSTQMP